MSRRAAPARSSKRDALASYRRKRHFDRTTEPPPAIKASTTGHAFVVQKHAARNLHYDFRLELDATLKSWAVPKGPSLDPRERRLSVQVEDHPLDYGGFEGTIPEVEYGGGTVMLWDRGDWEPIGDPVRGYREGKLKFRLHGQRLRGEWTLVRMRGRDGGYNGGRNWLLIKAPDDEARSGTEAEITVRELRSVASGRTMNQIAQHGDRVWSNGETARTKAKSRLEKSKSARTSRKSTGRRSTSLRSLRQRICRMPGACAAPQPSSLSPPLATLVTAVPTTDEWLHEIKFDGYRLICFLDDGRVRLMTRRDKDWTARFPEVADALASLSVSAVLDGELIATDARGISNFQLLQNALRSQGRRNLQLYLFDVPWGEGFDLMQVPLIERKALLQSLIASPSSKGESSVIRYSDHVVGQGAALFSQACRTGLEGVVSKRVDSGYVSGRGRLWVKCKCTKRQEFVIGGMTKPKGSRHGFGALFLGYYDHGKLVYCGRVGTGFGEKTLTDLGARLSRLRRARTPFDVPPRPSEAKDVQWVEPRLVAEVKFAQWTRDGRLRQPTFVGLREDKEPTEVTRERAKPIAALTKPAPRAVRSARGKDGSIVAGVQLSNPDRVLYPKDKITKADLARYYDEIAEWILPHIVDRPLTLVRCPRGYQQTCFYQKHVGDGMPDAIRGVTIREKSGSGRYLVIGDRAGLISLVQLGTLEIHPWGCRVDDVEHPDRLVFDLDPGPDVPWRQVLEAARLTRKLLIAAGLESFVQVSGGKGLHVVAPLQPQAGWDQAKTFCRTIALTLQQHDPRTYVAKMSKSLRQGRIFVDYLRNARGATSVAPYSTRARSHAPIATPLRWEELAKVTSASMFTPKSLLRRMTALRSDPWAHFFDVRQTVPS